MLLVSLFSLLSYATPPLMVAADLGAPGMQVWWREGTLLAGNPDEPGRPGIQPLVEGRAPLTLPTDLQDWVAIGQSCETPPSAQISLGPSFVHATVVTAANTHQVVRLSVADTVLAENTLGRPATVCSIDIVQADHLPGPEVLVSWRLGPDGEASQVRGLTVFRIPETARY